MKIKLKKSPDFHEVANKYLLIFVTITIPLVLEKKFLTISELITIQLQSINLTNMIN